MRILLLARYSRRGASSRIRCYQYLDFLQNAGIEVTEAPLLDDRYLERLYAGHPPRLTSLVAAYWRRIAALRRRRRFDLIWTQYELLPWLPDVVEAGLAGSATPIVVDYDDAQFHRYDQHANPIVRRILGRKLDRVMRRAAVVVVGNRYLAERAVAAGARDVRVLPSAVDLARYGQVEVPSRRDVFTIGWIGSPTTAPYLRAVSGALQEVADRIPTRIVLVGAGPVALPGLRVELRPWSEATEVAELRTFDVGIMPLTDGTWERGKCGFKLIQYMAVGRPVVASPVGFNTELVQPGQTGLLAASRDEWREALLSLAASPGAATCMGLAGRTLVEAEYSTQAVAPRLIEALAAAGSRRHRRPETPESQRR